MNTVRAMTSLCSTPLATEHPAQAADVRHTAGAQLLHQLLHLGKLLQQPVDVGSAGAAAHRDPAAAAGLDELGPPPLVRGHRVDDCLDPLELPLIHCLLSGARHL